MNPKDLIFPSWPAPTGVRACVTTRSGGGSKPPWQSLNLGDHVGDDPDGVRQNRARVKNTLQLPTEPDWLKQVHGCDISSDASPLVCADAAVTRQPDRVCAVLTADCLPLLICNTAGTQVAAVHAGWRGLVAGVIDTALARFSDKDELLVWLGPAIGPKAFEVGAEVREAFLTRDPANEMAFRANRPQHWLADIYQLARNSLADQKVQWVGGGGFLYLPRE